MGRLLLYPQENKTGLRLPSEMFFRSYLPQEHQQTFASSGMGASSEMSGKEGEEWFQTYKFLHKIDVKSTSSKQLSKNTVDYIRLL